MVLTLCLRVLYRSQNKVQHLPCITEYQEYYLGDKGGLWAGLTTLPPSCANCLEILEPQPPGTLRACPGL